MPLTEAEIQQFVMNGRAIMTGLAIHMQQLEDWKESFEARGGAAMLGEDALQIVSFVANPVVALVEGDATMQTVIAKFRTDF